MQGNAMRRTFVRLLLLAVLVRALVPAGFMPDAGHGHGLSLVICTSSGTRVEVADLALGKSDHRGKRASHAGDVCPFGDLTGPALSPGWPRVLARASPLRATPRLATAQLPPARSVPALGSRAPPLAG